MTIKFASVTLIRNIEKEPSWFDISRYIDFENIATNKDDIIILFDNGVGVNAKDEHKNSDIIFCKNMRIKIKEHTLYPEKPNCDKLDTLRLLKEHKNYFSSTFIGSRFSISYSYPRLGTYFTFMRIYSDTERLRFLLAYNDKIFTQNDIIYLVKFLLTEKWEALDDDWFSKKS